ncbi:hypothetical protein MMC07_001920 [Pseudocyphellaria aurata]|nr:hypothetical protein [Pseudocyphellaria aurata]
MKPTILSPSSRFRVPHKNGLTRSPSRSPNRQQTFMSHELDPLLSNLSPTSTLEALEATEAIDSEGKSGQSLLQESVAAASTSERALGIRAALAGKKLKEWHRELTTWPWPESSQSSRNGFLMLSQEEKRSNRSKPDHEGCLDKALSEQETVGNIENKEEVEYWGSLPAQLVRDYEHRVDMIRDDMEALGLEDLKDYVRDAHLTSSTRRLSRTMQSNGVAGTEYIHLDDFTAVITATIMHALPIISRLNSLLTTWSIRLVILRQIPGFLKLLENAQFNMAAAWNAIMNLNAAIADDDFEIAKVALHSKRMLLERNIFELGRNLDVMLDILEGREDTIPEEWIDRMENIEAEFGSWVVESEKSILEEEWRFARNNHESITRSKQDSHIDVDRADPLASVHEISQDTNPDEKRPSESTSGFTNISPLQSSLSLAAPFGYDGEANGREEHIVATPNLKVKPFDIDLKPSDSPKPSSQGHPQLSNQKSHTASGVKAVESVDDDIPSFHDINIQNEVDKSAVSTALDKKVAMSLDPVDSSSSTLDPFELNSSAEFPQRDILNPGTLSSSRGLTAFVNDLEKNGLSDKDDDPSLTEPSNSTHEPRTSGPLSMPADISSLDSSKFQLPKNIKGKGSPTPRPPPLLIKQFQPNMESTASSDISSDTSVPGSGTSEYFSNMSSPEIQQASMAEYFENPVEVTTPLRGPSTPLDMFSRRSSLLTERGENGIPEPGPMQSFPLALNHRRRASSFAPDSAIPESIGFEDEMPVHRQNVRSHVRVRSASLKSFEIIPRREVRNVTIKRSESYQSVVPGLQNLQKRDTSADDTPTTQIPHAETAILTVPGEATFMSLNQDSDDQLRSEFADEFEKQIDTFGPATLIDSSPSSMAKSRHRLEHVRDLSPGPTTAKLQRRKAIHVATVNPNLRKGVTPPPVAKSLANSEDQLEARISSILTEIPGHIRLKSGPEPDAPDVIPSNTFPDHRKPDSRSPAARLKKPPTSMSSSPLTLTPAHSKSSRIRASGGDSEIKLYHLHQSGKDAPVKLFVRLVGEGGERVMVRIGGGWADLGEYLKEYASHHGRRSISDGRFEIQGLPQSQSNTPISTLAGISGHASSSTSRPDTPATRPSSSLSFRFPQHSANSSADLDAPMTPENPTLSRFEPTPGSTETTHSSLRPSSRLSSTDEDSPLGLAGPNTRRKDVSPSKQAWVDEMVVQARKASAELNSAEKNSAEKKKGGVDREFGNLGRVGSTQRVFMRSKKNKANLTMGTGTSLDGAC